jgi:uncharacterized paraquat-inducible protein A
MKREGYLLIDNRAAGDGMVESATVTCSHCHRVVVLNPQRTRERGYCPKCDSYICDQCEAVRASNGYSCVTMTQVFDELEERIVRHGSVGSIS